MSTEQATETTLQLYANPLLIQDKQLSLFEEHVFDGKSVLDGNNVFTFGLEMDATMTASIVNEMTNNFQSLYPSRAQTMSDLYRHLSDYDYVDMFSTPSSTSIELIFDRDFLIANAPVNADNTNENLVVLPEFSTFTIGEHTFGIHYPIKITIRKAYKSDGSTIDYDNTIFQCVWDTTTVNPLYRLTSNVLEHRIYQRNGIKLFCLSVPVQQFSTTILKEDSISSTGFIKRYGYTDRFYAIRVFHYQNNTWTEMSETLSDVIYNPNEPVAKVKVLSDMHLVEVSIPQVCFTEGLIGNRIMCMLYTTEGALDLDIRNYSTDQFGASFLVNDSVVDDTYSAFLKRIPYLQVVPLSTRINNGTNGKTFSEMKNRVMNSVGGDDLLVTPAQISAHLSDIGFNVTKYIDNITNRIYVASKTITDSNANVIASGEFMTTLTSDILSEADKSYNTIKVISDEKDKEEYMIMPNSIFKYDADTDSMIPLSRYQIKNIFSDLTTEEMIKAVNDDSTSKYAGVYTFTPFHVKLSAATDIPMAGAYDLMKPQLTEVTFEAENQGTITQVSMYGNYLEHKDAGTAGYRLTIALYKTNDLNDVNPLSDEGETQIIVILRTTNADEAPIYLKGSFIGNNSDDKNLIAFDIGTDYKITSDNQIDTTSFTLINDYATEPNVNYVDLEQKYELMFFISRDIVSDEAAITNTAAIANIPKEIRDKNFVWLATQSFKLKLGEPISNLMANTFVTIEGENYSSYASTEYATYLTDIYARYEHEEEEYIPITYDVVVQAGDVFYQNTGTETNPKYKVVTTLKVGDVVHASDNYYQKIIHYIGDLKYDSNAQPILKWHSGELILTNSLLDPTDLENYIGLRAPSFSITTSATDATETSTLVEISYMSCEHRTATANTTNVWYPFRAYQHPVSNVYGRTNDTVVDTSKSYYTRTYDETTGTYQYNKVTDPQTSELYKYYELRESSYRAIFTGITEEVNNATIGKTGKLTKTSDLLKVAIDTIEKDASQYYVHTKADTFFEAKRIRTTFTDSGQELTKAGYAYNETTKKYYLTADTRPTAFLWIIDDSDDTTDAPFHIIHKTELNAESQTIDVYELKSRTVVDGQVVALDRPWSEYGALYRRDPEASVFDFTSFLTEDELCRFYRAIDMIPTDATNYDTRVKAVYEEFNLDETIAKQVEAFRCPWIKMLETFDSTTPREEDQDQFEYIPDYWNSRSILNFRCQYAHGSRDIDENHSLKLITTNSGSVYGVNALRYLQEVAVNDQQIDTTYLEVTTESMKAVNDDQDFKLYWIANYSSSLDTTAINYDGTTGTAESPVKPLIRDQEITGVSQSKGALLWATHESAGDKKGKHYVVITGPTKLSCYNELMSINTFSGMCYMCDTYSADRFICSLDGYNRVSTYQKTTDTEIDQSKTYYVQVYDESTKTYRYDVVTDPIVASISTYYELLPIEYDSEAAAEAACYDLLCKTKDAESQIQVAKDPLYSFICIITSEITSGYKDIDLNLLDPAAWTPFWPWESSNWMVVPGTDETMDQYSGTSIGALGISMSIGSTSTDAKILHLMGDIIIDSNGSPVTNSEKDERQLIYHTNMIHCDYKLLMSNDSEYQTYRSDVQELLRSYFNLLTATKPQLLERTELYYSPIKSMGYGQFKGSSGDEITHLLEITVDLRLHVSSTIGSNETSKTQITSNVLSIVEQHIANGNISCTALANEIRTAMSDTILYVDVLGINGDTSVQTLISADTNKSAVRLKSLLQLSDDGTITVVKGVNIEWSILK